MPAAAPAGAPFPACMPAGPVRAPAGYPEEYRMRFINTLALVTLALAVPLHAADAKPADDG